MMNIEIAEPGRMTQSGSSLLRLIQNNSMPILDLLVRESIQNSLDASNNLSDYVKVEFITGKFKTKRFNAQLEGVEEKLNNLTKKEESSFLAIKDSNTNGLTGKMHYEEVENNDYGNLLKLVYEISKPQENIGAGGSWGLGKTIYFRLGIGLVIYYSRILNENNRYESRLAVSLVEDENREDAIIPQVGNQVKRGIAWWGKKIDKNKTIPITDEKIICEILDVFNIKEYEKNETGTTVIIPYINEQKVLAINKYDTEQNSPYWNLNMDEYLKIAIQRWYSPRIDNNKYSYGNWLKVLVNDEEIKSDTLQPVFKIIQDMYISAITNSSDKENINIKSIKIKNELTNQNAGTLVYTKIDKKVLKMLPPDNSPNPFKYIGIENLAGDRNKPIILYTRKPGMIVSYETTGEWVDSILETESDEFIIGIFVLNSENKVLTTQEISLEEYVRQGEKADHTSWNDWSIEGKNHKIISKIKSHVRANISKSYNEVSDSENERKNNGLGKLFGDILLPPRNFGNRPSVGEGRSGGSISTSNGIKLKIDNENIQYHNDGIKLPFVVMSEKKIQEFELNIGVLTENGIISIREWECDLDQNTSFLLNKVILKNLVIEENTINDNLELSCDEKQILKDNLSEVKFVFSDKEVPYGIRIKFYKEVSFKIQGVLDIKVFDRSIKPVLQIHMIEESK